MSKARQRERKRNQPKREKAKSQQRRIENERRATMHDPLPGLLFEMMGARTLADMASAHRR